jgi:hypothetical protein
LLEYHVAPHAVSILTSSTGEIHGVQMSGEHGVDPALLVHMMQTGVECGKLRALECDAIFEKAELIAN